MARAIVCTPLGFVPMCVPAGHELRVHPHIVEEADGWQCVRSFYGEICGAPPYVKAESYMVPFRGPRGERSR